jgi:hypothetical protein
MRSNMTFHYRLLGYLEMSLVALVLQSATTAAADELADAEAAVKKAAQEEIAATAELDSRAMTHAATREIARAEQQRCAEALQRLATANEDLERKIAEKAPEAEIIAARQLVEQRLDTMRAVAERLVADSLAHDQAAQEFIVSQNTTQNKGIALRAAQHAVLELKAKADKKAVAETSRRAVHENEALIAWENKLWADEQRDRMQETVDINDGAIQVAAKLADAEPDAERKKKLEGFIKTETERRDAMAKLVAGRKAEFDDADAKIYPPRAAALGGLTPLDPSDWDYAKARHLLARAGFGGTPQEVERLCAMGPYKAVDHLLQFHEQPAADAPLDITQPLPTDPFESQLRKGVIPNGAS